MPSCYKLFRSNINQEAHMILKNDVKGQKTVILNLWTMGDCVEGKGFVL